MGYDIQHFCGSSEVRKREPSRTSGRSREARQVLQLLGQMLLWAAKKGVVKETSEIQICRLSLPRKQFETRTFDACHMYAGANEVRFPLVDRQFTLRHAYMLSGPGPPTPPPPPRHGIPPFPHLWTAPPPVAVSPATLCPCCCADWGGCTSPPNCMVPNPRSVQKADSRIRHE